MSFFWYDGHGSRLTSENQVGISSDDYYDKSIDRIYGRNKHSSANPSITPSTKEDVKNNMSKHTENSHFLGMQRVSNHLIKNGRALNSTSPLKDFEAIGYYYMLYEENGMFVGLCIFIGADGYICCSFYYKNNKLGK